MIHKSGFSALRRPPISCATSLTFATVVGSSVSGIVKNCGAWGSIAPPITLDSIAPLLRELTDEDWEHVRNVVLDGALYLTRALIGPMVENKYGNILFFVGDGACSGRGSGRAHLSAAKMALVGLARGLASEFAPHNIRVNVVSPGSIDTRRDNPEWYGNRPPNADGIPLGRQGKIDEIAATCLFLVSDGGGFITGQTIHVNGGAGYY